MSNAVGQVSRRGQGTTEIEHGTTGGYRKELRRGIKTCAACRKAARRRGSE